MRKKEPIVRELNAGRYTHKKTRCALSTATWSCSATHSIQPRTSGNTALTAGRLIPTPPISPFVRSRYDDVVPLDPACHSPSVYLPGVCFLLYGPPPHRSFPFNSLGKSTTRTRVREHRYLPPRCSESVRRRNIAPWFS